MTPDYVGTRRNVGDADNCFPDTSGNNLVT